MRIRKGLAIALTAMLLLATVAMGASVARADGAFNFTSPNDGDTWELGTTHAVAWTYGGIGTLWDHTSIVLHDGSGSTELFSTDNVREQLFNWTIPNDLVPGAYEMDMDLVLINGTVIVADVASFNIVVPDTTPPTVVNVFPGDGYYDTSFPVTWNLHVNFSEPMNRASVEGAFTLKLGEVLVPGTFFWFNDTLMFFDPDERLAYSTEYTIDIGIEAMDLAGNHLASVFTSTFTTMANPDPTLPTILNVWPADGGTGIYVEANMHVNFSEPMDWTSVEGAFGLTTGGVPVAGNFWYVAGMDSTIFFKPTGNLPYSTEYTIDIGTGAMDLAGNALAAPYTSKFTTAADPDAPMVTVVYPADGATDVPRYWMNGWRVTVNFDRPMDLASVQSALSLSTGGQPITGYVNGYLETAYFIPDDHLPYGTEVTVMVSTQARSADGHYLAAPFVSTFTVMADPGEPEVEDISPAIGAADVPLDQAITLDFDQAMHIDSVQSALTLSAGGQVVDCDFIWNANFAHYGLVPTSPLQYGTEYTITVSTLATSWDGIQLPSTFSSTFTTAADPNYPAIDLTLLSSNSNTGTALVGETIWYKYTVVNAGNVPLSGVAIYDDVLGNISSFNGDVNNDGLLDPGETWWYSASWVVRAGPDPLVNTAYAWGWYGNTTRVEDSASISLDVINPDTTPPTIDSFSPSSPLTVYSPGASATQTLAATYSDNVGIVAAWVTLDGFAVTGHWGVSLSGFSYTETLPAGQHVIVLNVIDDANNWAQQVWVINVVQDAESPTISGFVDNQIVKSPKTTPWIVASFADGGSGVDVSTVKIFLDGKEVTTNCIISKTGLKYPTALIAKGTHLFYVQVYDKVGNLATASWHVKVGDTYKGK